MDKWQNKYRIPTARLQNFDYGQNGAYFITICTDRRKHFFGKVVHEQMCLNEIGNIAESIWLEIQQQFDFIELGNFVIMPNHVHGILIINKETANHPVETQFIPSDIPSVEKKMPLMASLRGENVINGGFSGNMNPMLQENISKIIR